MLKEIRTKISPSWYTFISELNAMFGEDPDIRIEHNQYKVKMYVADANKASALFTLLPMYKDYGNVTLSIDVISPNGEIASLDTKDYSLIWETAFKNNPVLSFVKKVEGIFGFSAIYVVFKNKVVQYFNDNLNDIYGNTSTLYEDIATDIFDEVKTGTFFCTDVVDNKLKKPLGEWP